MGRVRLVQRAGGGFISRLPGGQDMADDDETADQSDS